MKNRYKIICALMTFVMLLSTFGIFPLSASAQESGTAQITIYGLNGQSETKTFPVGDTFTVYTVLNTSETDGNGVIATIDAKQTYTNGVLVLNNEMDEDNLITDAGVFPVLGSYAIGRKVSEGTVSYNASTPQLNRGFNFDSSDDLLIVTSYTVTAAGEGEIRNSVTTLAAADYRLTKIVSKGNIVSGNERLVLKAAFRQPGSEPEVHDAHIAAHSISLGGDIGVNFYVELTDDIAQSNTAYMRFTIPSGDTTEIQTAPVKDAVQTAADDTTYYILKCGVAAKEMTSQIQAQIIDENYQSEIFTYSVKEYADYLLAHTGDNPRYAEAAPLVKAMLNYGACAQRFFGKDTDNLANADLSYADRELGDVSIDVSNPTAALPQGVTLAGATLSLKAETTLSLYFNSSAVLRFSCDGMDVDTDVVDGYKVARIRNISAADLGKTFTLSVNGDYYVTYSPMNYCRDVLSGGSDDVNLQDTVKALYRYRLAAEDYFS